MKNFMGGVFTLLTLAGIVYIELVEYSGIILLGTLCCASAATLFLVDENKTDTTTRHK